jgi:hypothetical protein
MKAGAIMEGGPAADEALFRLILEAKRQPKPEPVPVPLVELADAFNTALAGECPEAAAWTAVTDDDAARAFTVPAANAAEAPELILLANQPGLQRVIVAGRAAALALAGRLLGGASESTVRDLTLMERLAVSRFLAAAFPAFAPPPEGFACDGGDHACALLSPSGPHAAKGDAMPGKAPGILLLANRRNAALQGGARMQTAGAEQQPHVEGLVRPPEEGLRHALAQGSMETMQRILAPGATLGSLASLAPGAVIRLGQDAELRADVLAQGRLITSHPLHWPHVPGQQASGQNASGRDVSGAGAIEDAADA